MDKMKTFVLRYRIVFWGLPVLVISCLFFLVYKKPFYLVDAGGLGLQDRKIVKLQTSTDREHNGNSEIAILENTPKKLRFRYTYRDGYIYTYTAASFSFDTAGTDFSEYDYMTIKIRSAKGKRILVGIYYNDPFLGEIKDPATLRLSQAMLDVKDKPLVHNIYFKDMFTPSWWFVFNNRLEDARETGSLSSLKELYFSGCINLPKNVQDEIEIEEVSFFVNMTPYYILSGSFLICYYAGLSWLLFRKKKKKKTVVNFNHNGQMTNDPVLKYLTTNYSNSDLDMTYVLQQTGVTEKQLVAIIKEQTDLTFKQFLNALRLAEAKRLLNTTDLNISEIAFKVGYSNVSHFNKVFKIAEDCSPNEYRKQQVVTTA